MIFDESPNNLAVGDHSVVLSFVGTAKYAPSSTGCDLLVVLKATIKTLMILVVICVICVISVISAFFFLLERNMNRKVYSCLSTCVTYTGFFMTVKESERTSLRVSPEVLAEVNRFKNKLMAEVGLRVNASDAIEALLHYSEAPQRSYSKKADKCRHRYIKQASA